MLNLDRGHARLGAWVMALVALSLTLYSQQIFVLGSGLNQLLTSTLGTVFPAYPFLALLVLLTALRWKDFHKVLMAEGGPLSHPGVRIGGLVLVILPVVLWTLFIGQMGPTSYLAMEMAASSLVVAAYGALLATNPTMWRIMLPYASLYAVGLVSPLFMLDALGAPLASFSSYVAAGMTGALGLHVAWQGVSFGFVSAGGENISAVVTPVCSAVYSISIYLALLGLMYLDMGSSVTKTALFAVVGVLVIPVLDSARIALMIWFGFVDGSTAFWGVHDWLGYVMFFTFYVTVLVAYSWRGSLRSGTVAAQSLQTSLNS